MAIELLYQKVKHITHRTRREYYVHGWELADWDQEGRICLYQLLSQAPELADDLSKLYIYYKTKFRNRIIDEVRKQTNTKRKVNMVAYEDIHETGERIQTKGLSLEEYYLFYEGLNEYRKTLTSKEKEQLNHLLAERRFKGRKQMLHQLSFYLCDLQN